MGKLKTVPVPRKLPVVLSREEVSRLLEATSSLKYKAAFSVAYGAGLRMNEVATLKISDIDGERKTLQTIAADPRHLGARNGLTLVLHTWGSAIIHTCTVSYPVAAYPLMVNDGSTAGQASSCRYGCCHDCFDVCSWKGSSKPVRPVS